MPVRLLQYILKFISDAFLERAVSAATPIPLVRAALAVDSDSGPVCTLARGPAGSDQIRLGVRGARRGLDHRHTVTARRCHLVPVIDQLVRTGTMAYVCQCERHGSRLRFKLVRLGVTGTGSSESSARHAVTPMTRGG